MRYSGVEEKKRSFDQSEFPQKHDKAVLSFWKKSVDSFAVVVVELLPHLFALPRFSARNHNTSELAYFLCSAGWCATVSFFLGMRRKRSDSLCSIGGNLGEMNVVE